MAVLELQRQTLNTCNRDHIARKAESIDYLTLYRTFAETINLPITSSTWIFSVSLTRNQRQEVSGSVQRVNLSQVIKDSGSHSSALCVPVIPSLKGHSCCGWEPHVLAHQSSKEEGV